VVFNLTAAVAIGFLATMFLFIGKISRSIIRRTYDGEARHSLRVWDQESVACLHEHRRDIRVIELEGAVFFGTADLLAREAEELSKNAHYVLLDFKHVNEIDSTGALILLQLAAVLKRQHKILVLSHLTPAESTWHFLADMGINKVLTEDLWFSDMDAALEWIECRILETAIPLRQTAQEHPLASVSLAAGLDHAGLMVLARCLTRLTFAKGVALFHEGDAGDCLYLLTQGVVSIKLRLKNTDRARRLGTYGPGVMFGEMALLEGKPRSADAVTEEDSVVYSLSRESLQRLQEHHPVVAATVLLNISRELANRLRVTTTELRAAT
jgi:sulfate permease, SulP family